MKLIFRLRKRIQYDGILNTLKYIIYASFYCLRELLCNILIDLVCSHRLLNGNIKTSYQWLGSNDIYHSKYSALPIIFRFIRIKRSDVLVDVGCGKGRVINYWIFRGYKNKIIGLELDKKIAIQTAKQFSRLKNITIVPGNALLNIPPDATVFYFYNPFSKEMVIQFEAILSKMFLNKPIKIIYYNPKSIDAFNNGKWIISYINFEKDLGYRRWGRINKYHDLAIIKNII
jgi:SAM-dependent methyltransferase